MEEMGRVGAMSLVAWAVTAWLTSLVCVCVCVCVVVGKARWMVSGGVGSARRGYSSVVEHSTADREVPVSIPGAPSLALVAPAVCESAARPRRASCRRGFASSR